jgi:hypothetical protein
MDGWAGGKNNNRLINYLVLGLGLGLGKKDVGILLFITPYCLQAMY